VDSAWYLVNRSPTLALVDKTLHEVWTGKNFSLKHLRVFGCDAYVHVPRENNSKIENKFEKCIFNGDKDGLKCYQLWNPVTNNTIYSWDVAFREVKYVPKYEFQQKREEPNTIELELEVEELASTKEAKTEEEEPLLDTWSLRLWYFINYIVNIKLGIWRVLGEFQDSSKLLEEETKSHILYVFIYGPR